MMAAKRNFGGGGVEMPFLKALKDLFPDKYTRAEEQCLTLCLPESQLLQTADLSRLGESFFDAHILREQRDEGWFRGGGADLPLIVEKQGPRLKLLSAPGYHPSFARGLHTACIKQVLFGVNKKFQQYRMYVLDRPLIPKYTRAKLTTSSVASSPSISRSSSGVSSQSATDSALSSAASSHVPSTTTTRVLSSTSLQSGRPYSTTNDQRRPSVTNAAAAAGSSRRHLQNGSTTSIPRSKYQPSPLQGVNTKKQKTKTVSGTESTNSRQWSADSGIEEGADSLDAKFILPPRITSYGESESYLMSLPRCEQFVTHLARNLRPMMTELKFSSRNARSQLMEFAPRLKRLAQEQFVAFPRSASLVNNSPRFQEFLRLAVENVIMRFVHDRLFPVICHLSRQEDQELLLCADYLHRTGFSTDQLGLPEDFCTPLPAAVVELASLDMRTTPLDRLTCFYDAVEQVNQHIREAVLASRADSEDVTIPDDLPSPDDHDLVLLIATVIVSARPTHLMSTLNYADLFAWSVPIDMIEVVKLVSSAADLIRNIQPKKLLPSSGKLKREVSMEEIIQLTDEVQQNFDRHGNRVEPLKSALDLHRERFAQCLEKSTADRTRRQEEAWARLDQCATPERTQQQHTGEGENGRFKRGLLSSLHSKLICSTDPSEVVENTRS